ncbi:MAG: PHP domain-containing protein [Nannocystaceae bacterium]|nr:PHP domain-containing protein [Nannocystaceae bacterium]
MQLNEDMHVHTTFSDGRHSVEASIDHARARGLKRLGLADHVRAETDWLSTYVDHINAVRESLDMEVVIGVEAKLLDEVGTLDLPDDITGIERILVADHRLPLRGELLGPRQVREALREGTMSAPDVWDTLLYAYEGCALRYENLQLAHPLSFVSRVGLDERDIPRARIVRFAHAMANAGVAVEVSERWKCPHQQTLLILAEAGVELVASSDAHDARAIGVYNYVRALAV